MNTYNEIDTSVDNNQILIGEILKIKSIISYMLDPKLFLKRDNQYHLYDINNNQYTFLSLIYPKNLNIDGEKISLRFVIAPGYLNDKDEFFTDPNHIGIPESEIETILLDLVSLGSNEINWLERVEKKLDKSKCYTSENITELWCEKYLSKM